LTGAAPAPETALVTRSVTVLLISVLAALVARGDERDDGVGAWAVGHDMNEVRMAPARVVLGSRVLVIGGWDDDLYRAGNTAEIYDPDRDTWTYVAPVPRRSVGPGFAAVLPSGKVLHAGGFVFTRGNQVTPDWREANLCSCSIQAARRAYRAAAWSRGPGLPLPYCPARVPATSRTRS
jgi:hypothetical protein